MFTISFAILVLPVIVSLQTNLNPDRESSSNPSYQTRSNKPTHQRMAEHFERYRVQPSSSSQTNLSHDRESPNIASSGNPSSQTGTDKPTYQRFAEHFEQNYGIRPSSAPTTAQPSAPTTAQPSKKFLLSKLFKILLKPESKRKPKQKHYLRFGSKHESQPTDDPQQPTILVDNSEQPFDQPGCFSILWEGIKSVGDTIKETLSNVFCSKESSCQCNACCVGFIDICCNQCDVESGELTAEISI